MWDSRPRIPFEGYPFGKNDQTNDLLFSELDSLLGPQWQLVKSSFLNTKSIQQYGKWRATAGLHSGDPQDGAQSIRLMLQMMDRIQSESLIISYLVRIAGFQITMHSKIGCKGMSLPILKILPALKKALHPRNKVKKTYWGILNKPPLKDRLAPWPFAMSWFDHGLLMVTAAWGTSLSHWFGILSAVS